LIFSKHITEEHISVNLRGKFFAKIANDFSFKQRENNDTGSWLLFIFPSPPFVISVTNRVMTLVRGRVGGGGGFRQNKQSPPRIIHTNPIPIRTKQKLKVLVLIFSFSFEITY
jgi:hypothetical protein